MKKKNTVALIFLGTSLSLMALTLKESPIIPIAKISQQNINKFENRKRKIQQQIHELQSEKQTLDIRIKIRKLQKELGHITKQIRIIRRKLTL